MFICLFFCFFFLWLLLTDFCFQFCFCFFCFLFFCFFFFFFFVCAGELAKNSRARQKTVELAKNNRARLYLQHCCKRARQFLVELVCFLSSSSSHEPKVWNEKYFLLVDFVFFFSNSWQKIIVASQNCHPRQMLKCSIFSDTPWRFFF